MKARLLTITGLFFAAAFSMSAMAQGQKSFSDLDENDDGYISADETKEDSIVAGSWYKYDEDRDAMLSKSEFSALEDAEPEQVFYWQEWYLNYTDPFVASRD